MHLIESLCSGIRGAENGHVELYRRGTSTRATWYTDFEASSQNSSGDNVTLDANGAALVFVNELVTVHVKDADGALVRNPFTAGVNATAVEVISPSFFGRDYVTGDQDVQKPTTLSSILDLFVASFGAADANVLFRGTDRTLQAALADVDLGYYNVKSATYGATGNGATDDQAAIQAALTAAGVAGGVVFFPPGTYRCGSTLTVPQNVSLLGSGPASSTLRLGHATQDLINFSATAVRGCTIEGLRFENAIASSGNLIEITQADTRLTVRNCHFVTSVLVPLTGVLITSGLLSGLQVWISDCHFTMSDVSANAITLQRGSPVIIGCQFVAPAGVAANQCIRADGEGAFIALCRFDLTAVSGGTHTAILANNNLTAGRPCIAIGNTFTGVAGGTHAAIQMACTGGRGAFEVANNVAPGLGLDLLGIWDGTSETVGMTSWENRMLETNIAAATTHTLSNEYGHQTLVSTGAPASLAITAPTVRVGARLTLVWHNNTSGTFAPSILGNVRGDVLISSNLNTFTIVHFYGVHVNGANYWAVHQAETNLAE